MLCVFVISTEKDPSHCVGSSTVGTKLILHVVVTALGGLRVSAPNLLVIVFKDVIFNYLLDA